MIADRHGVYDLITAGIVNAALYDNGIIGERHMELAVDANKVKRWKKKEETMQIENSSEVFHSGFKSKTNYDSIVITENGKRKRGMLHHIVMVIEPKSVYLGHLIVSGETAREICNVMAK